MTTQKQIDRIGWTQITGRFALVVGVVSAALLIFGGEKPEMARPDRTLVQDQTPTGADRADRLVSMSSSPTRTARIGTKPIEHINVGDRVLAHNPEVTDAERANCKEPDWSDWLHLSLVMPKEDGLELKIELLRPESWALEQVSYIVDETTSVVEDTGAPGITPLSLSSEPEPAAPETLVPLSPLRTIYREVALTAAVLDSAQVELIGLTVEMDLPEMGATGTAVITDIHPCPTVHPGQGQPVTATFSHPPSTAVLNVIFEGESKPIGVTDNHLFWSVDRQQFLAIGKMEIGESVQTFHGETKRIGQMFPRPGPEVVYNLEVYGEHVYFVGQQGLLAHNSYNDFMTKAEQFGISHESARYLHRRLREGITAGGLSRYEASIARHGLGSSQTDELLDAFATPGMGNQLGDQLTELYFLRDRGTNRIHKIGETTTGEFPVNGIATRTQTRYTQKFLNDNNLYYQPLRVGTKHVIHAREGRLLDWLAERHLLNDSQFWPDMNDISRRQ